MTTPIDCTIYVPQPECAPPPSPTTTAPTTSTTTPPAEHPPTGSNIDGPIRVGAIALLCGALLTIAARRRKLAA